MRNMDASNVTSKRQVTIPKAIRRELGIGQGSRVAFASLNGKIGLRVVHRAPPVVASGFGMLESRGRRLPADFDAAGLPAPKRGAGKAGAR
jgi:AbrB family looped-hinge helix DNA binding protein